MLADYVSLKEEISDPLLPTFSSEEVISAEKIENELPLPSWDYNFVLQSRKTVQAILQGQDSRKLLIVGPCSIHDRESTLEYAKYFKQLSSDVSDQFFLVMRAYFEKPRTSLGWKGFLYDPDLNGSYDISKGIRLTRKLLLELTRMHIPLASELLEINTAPYYKDFLTWGCVGARTSTSPPHRQLVSGLGYPVGFKNTADGNIENAIRAVVSSNSPHSYLGISHEGKLSRIKTGGNPFCHLILRGGENTPNYLPENVQEAMDKCLLAGANPRIMIDCSHDNCKKNHKNQISVFNFVMDQIIEGNSPIFGLMLESHLHEGAQLFGSEPIYGISLTDPCLDIETTSNLIRKAHLKMQDSLKVFI